MIIPTANDEYSNTVKAKKKTLKNNFLNLKIIEVVKKEMKNSLKAIEDKNKIDKSLEKCKKPRKKLFKT